MMIQSHCQRTQQGCTLDPNGHLAQLSAGKPATLHRKTTTVSTNSTTQSGRAHKRTKVVTMSFYLPHQKNDESSNLCL